MKLDQTPILLRKNWNWRFQKPKELVLELD